MSATPTKPILTELITKLKNSRDYKHHLKLFKEFIAKKDGPATAHVLHYYLYFDLDELKFKISSEYDITYNSLVLTTGSVPSRKSKNEEKKIEDYQFEWGNKI